MVQTAHYDKFCLALQARRMLLKQDSACYQLLQCSTAICGLKLTLFKKSTLVLQGRCMLTFGKTVDAVRFCHAAQTNVLFHRWPPEALDMCGPIEHTPDGRLLFRGPRVAMAVHETDDYE